MPFIALLIAALIVAIDQGIKLLIASDLRVIGERTVIDGVLSLRYVENRGVAFGMFQDMRWLFVAITAVMLIAIILFMFKKKPSGKFFYICAGLIIGGGVGNLIDRIIYGYVIDYISLSFFPPVCNFADYAITIGVFLLIIYLFFFSDRFKKKKDIDND